MGLCTTIAMSSLRRPALGRLPSSRSSRGAGNNYPVRCEAAFAQWAQTTVTIIGASPGTARTGPPHVSHVELARASHSRAIERAARVPITLL
jgi:hypothetical protein